MKFRNIKPNAFFCWFALETMAKPWPSLVAGSNQQDFDATFFLHFFLCGSCFVGMMVSIAFEIKRAFSKVLLCRHRTEICDGGTVICESAKGFPI